MTATKRVGVRLVAENGRQVKAEFKGVGDAGEQAFDRIGRSADTAGSVVRRVFGVLTAAVSIRQIAQYADTWTDLRSRVDLATGSQERGALVMERLSDMARRTYSSLEQTTESYLANATALRELGMSTGEALDFTEALNNALVVSGARQERAASVSNALSQAMALGVLRGDQLNTVIQSGGRVAELLAAEMGVTVSQLRALGTQGAITGDVIRRALVGNLELLREEADGMPATIGDAFGEINNAMLKLVGTFDTLHGASSTVAAGIIYFAENLQRLASYGIALAGFMSGRFVAGIIAARVATMSLSGALLLLRGAIIRTGIGAVIVAAGELIYWFSRLVQGAGSFGEALTILGDVARGAWTGIWESARSIPPNLRATWLQVQAGFFEMVRNLQWRWADFIAGLARSIEGVPGFSALTEALDRAASNANRAGFANSEAAERARAEAEGASARAAQIAGAAFDDMRGAWSRMTDAITQSQETGTDALDDAAAAAGNVEDTLTRAGGAGGRSGRAIADGADEAATGWDALLEKLNEYAEQARDIGAEVGNVLVGAFRGIEDAIADFVKTGKFSFRDMITSMIADLARLAARRFILGPLMGALTNALGGMGGFGAAMASALAPARSFDGGGHTGYGARVGGLDGRGGYLAMVHPRERIIDETRGRRGREMAPVVVNIHSRDAESFRQSRTQIAADMQRAVAMGQRSM